MTLYRNLLSDTVFVFGSNLSGKHQDGVAAFAAKHYKAEFGIGEGPTGKSYAVPIADEHLENLPIIDIQWHVEQLLAYARTQREARFQLTRLGCGVGGFTDMQLAPMFKKTSDNLFVPGRWMAINHQLDRARLFVEGDSTFTAERIEKTLNECTLPWGPNIEVVTTGVGVVNDIVRAWARRKDLPWTPFLADHTRFGEEADEILDTQIAWYCTHAIVYHENVDRESRRMEALRKEGLKLRHFNA
jgi:hypothetical protein